MKAVKTYNPLEYGGDLLKVRYGRSRPRPLCNKNSMHSVLRSTRAVGPRSFRRPKHAHRLRMITAKFSKKFGVRIHISANVGNHLHFQIKLNDCISYAPFIRALTSAIAMAVDGTSRWKKAKQKFWDRRPYTRIAIGLDAANRLTRYIRLNQLEGQGFSKAEGRAMLGRDVGFRLEYG